MENNRPHLLLHACCGPCATTALERLIRDYKVSVFFYNPGIYPHAEYVKRKNETERYLLEAFGNQVLFIEKTQRTDFFSDLIQGLESEPEGGKRCRLCFQDRLTETALYAKTNGFDFFCTTLTLSPHKNATLINTLGKEIAQHIGGISYLPSDFKKSDGFRRSIDISKEYHLYRQTYCGCKYSM